MIKRYTRPEMGQIWTPENRWKYVLEVETQVAEAQAKSGMIPKAAAIKLRRQGKFSLARIEELEKISRHDVTAFVTNVAESIGEYGRYVHFGLTSSDVIDTALSLQIRDALSVLKTSMESLGKTLLNLVHKHAKDVCPGRTHGMNAEPTTFGFKMAGFYSEFKRVQNRLDFMIHKACVVKLSGPVGTFSLLPPEIEAAVAKKLRLDVEPIATQVVPRDRHAEVLFSLALLGSFIERLSVELRHLQRSEVGEVVEGFQKGQRGSSAMPHKKNPISAENLTGIARLLRSYLQAGLENTALWHERDISHSSVERVIFPDAFILADYSAHRMKELLEGLTVNTLKMQKNIEDSRGQLFSSQVLLQFIGSGLDREQAYNLTQRLAQSLAPSEDFAQKLKTDLEAKKWISAKQVDAIFSSLELKKRIPKLLRRIQ